MIIERVFEPVFCCFCRKKTDKGWQIRTKHGTPYPICSECKKTLKLIFLADEIPFPEKVLKSLST